ALAQRHVTRTRQGRTLLLVAAQAEMVHVGGDEPRPPADAPGVMGAVAVEAAHARGRVIAVLPVELLAPLVAGQADRARLGAGEPAGIANCPVTGVGRVTRRGHVQRSGTVAGLA